MLLMLSSKYIFCISDLFFLQRNDMQFTDFNKNMDEAFSPFCAKQRREQEFIPFIMAIPSYRIKVWRRKCVSCSEDDVFIVVKRACQRLYYTNKFHKLQIYETPCVTRRILSNQRRPIWPMKMVTNGWAEFLCTCLLHPRVWFVCSLC